MLNKPKNLQIIISMKKLTTSFLFFAFVSFNISLSSQTPCVTYHRQTTCSQRSEGGFIYNSQSKSGLFAKGTSSKLKVIFYAGFDYSISLCADKDLGAQIGLILTDAKTGEILYDNATNNKSGHMEFSCQTTRNIAVAITIPGSGLTKDRQPMLLVWVFLLNRKSVQKLGSKTLL